MENLTLKEKRKEVSKFLDDLQEANNFKVFEIVNKILDWNETNDILEELIEDASEQLIDRVLKIKEAQKEKPKVIKKGESGEDNKINLPKKSEVLLIDPRTIDIEKGFNTRIEYGDLDELMNSIIENGVKVPLRGYKKGERFVIVDGHRRLKATNKALEKGIDIKRVPFIVEKKKSLEERIFDILLFNDGKTLTPLELGETYKKLVGYGYTSSEISKKIGKSSVHVNQMIDVACSSKAVKTLIKNGNISSTLVSEVRRKAANKEEAEEIVKVVSEVKKEESKNGKTSKVTKKDVKDLLPEPKKVIEKGQAMFTKDEVIEMLKDQRKDCSRVVSLNLRIKVLKVALVLE